MKCVICHNAIGPKNNRCPECNSAMMALREFRKDWELEIGYASSLAMAKRIARQASLMKQHGRVVVHIKEDTWDQQREQFSIPWPKEAFFRNHPHGKIEVEVTSEGEDWIEGNYVC